MSGTTVLKSRPKPDLTGGPDSAESDFAYEAPGPGSEGTLETSLKLDADDPLAALKHPQTPAPQDQFRAPGASAELAIQMDLAGATAFPSSASQVAATVQAALASLSNDTTVVPAAFDPLAAARPMVAAVAGAIQDQGLTGPRGEPVDAEDLTRSILEQALNRDTGASVTLTGNTQRVAFDGIAGGSPTSWADVGIEDPEESPLLKFRNRTPLKSAG